MVNSLIGKMVREIMVRKIDMNTQLYPQNEYTSKNRAEFLWVICHRVVPVADNGYSDWVTDSKVIAHR